MQMIKVWSDTVRKKRFLSKLQQQHLPIYYKHSVNFNACMSCLHCDAPVESLPLNVEQPNRGPAHRKTHLLISINLDYRQKKYEYWICSTHELH